MTKLTKIETKRHAEAQAMVDDDRELTLPEREFVLDNWNPMANHNVGVAGAFFTPEGVADDMTVEVQPERGKRIVDLCAGIGRLAYTCWRGSFGEAELVCVELNPEYVAVGRRVLPEATWICGDVLDEATWEGVARDFHCAVSNPPYGNIKHDSDVSWTGLPNRGFSFEYKVAAVAAKLAYYGVFIVLDNVAGFRMRRSFEKVAAPKNDKMGELIGYRFEPNCGISLDAHRNEWKGVKAPPVELAVLGEVDDG